MIKLTVAKDSLWHPKGDAHGNPKKIDIDRFKVILVRVDYDSKILEVCGVHGHMENGEFVKLMDAGGSTAVFSRVVAQGDRFDSFFAGTKAKGAPKNNYRLEDIDDLLLDDLHFDGTREAD
jgi:hypothetical protein